MRLPEIPKKLRNLKRFTLKEAIHYGLSRRKLERLVLNDDIEKVSRGVYQISNESTKESTVFSVACKIASFPCTICFWSALVFYDLTDEIDIKTWVMVSSERRRSDKTIRLVRLTHPQWNIGIFKEKNYWITTIERTIIDSLAYPRFVGTMAATMALKKALNRKMTTISNLVEIASQLGHLKQVYPRLEAFIE